MKAWLLLLLLAPVAEAHLAPVQPGFVEGTGPYSLHLDAVGGLAPGVPVRLEAILVEGRDGKFQAPEEGTRLLFEARQGATALNATLAAPASHHAASKWTGTLAFPWAGVWNVTATIANPHGSRRVQDSWVVPDAAVQATPVDAGQRVEGPSRVAFHVACPAACGRVEADIVQRKGNPTAGNGTARVPLVREGEAWVLEHDFTGRSQEIRILADGRAAAPWKVQVPDTQHPGQPAGAPLPLSLMALLLAARRLRP